MLKSIHQVKRLRVAVIGFSVLAAFAVMMIRTGLTESNLGESIFLPDLQC